MHTRLDRLTLGGVRATLTLSLLLASFAATPASAWEWGYEGNVFTRGGPPESRVNDVATFPDDSVVSVGFVDQYSGTDLYENWVLARISRNIPSTPVYWSFELGSGTQSSFDQAERVAIDPAGNVFVGGKMWDVSASDYASRILKIDGSSGNTISSVFIPKPATSFFSPHYVRDLAVDSAGNVVVALGSSAGPLQVMKLDGADLTHTLWTYTEATYASGDSFDVSLDGNGDVLLAGTVNTANGSVAPRQALVAKLNGQTGGELWKNDTLPASEVSHGVICGNPPTGSVGLNCGSTSSTSLLVTSNGDAVVLAERTDDDSYVARLNATDGTVVWGHTVAALHPRSMASDYTTAVYVAGAGGASHDQFGIAAIDLTTGAQSWSTTYGPGYPMDIDVIGDGKPAAAGEIYNPDSDEYRFTVVTARPADGSEAWRYTSGASWGDALSIAHTPVGHAAVGGVNVGLFYDQNLEVEYYRATAVTVRLLSGDGSPFGECGNGFVDNPNEECDDGNLVDGDCCSSTCHFEPAGSPCDDGRACSTVDQCDGAGRCDPTAGDCCGDGVVEPTLGEECDDTGSCCISCSFDYGASCNDTLHPACHPAGVCGDCYHRFLACCDGPSICDCCSPQSSVSGGGCSNQACQDCVYGYDASCFDGWGSYCVAYAQGACASSCNCGATTTTTVPTTTTTTLPPFPCAVTPEAGCRQPVIPAKASLYLKNADDDGSDAVRWKWGKGAAIAPGDFENPLASDRYALCLYDESGAATLLYEMKVPAGRGWKGLGNPPLSKGAKYHIIGEPIAFYPDGITDLSLKPGDAGKTKIQAKGKGPRLPFLAGPAAVPLPIRVQLQAENGNCWEAFYVIASVNDGVKFKAKSQ